LIVHYKRTINESQFATIIVMATKIWHAPSATTQFERMRTIHCDFQEEFFKIRANLQCRMIYDSLDAITI
jgi:hypothetical protein